MDMARILSQESNCISLRVGCVIVKDSRIISMGYNGTVAGAMNCFDACDIKYRREEHHEWSNSHEVHAEMNALMYAARYGISVNGATLYCTNEPCDQCLKNIIAAGIERVVYDVPYKKELCKCCYRFDGTIKVEKIK